MSLRHHATAWATAALAVFVLAGCAAPQVKPSAADSTVEPSPRTCWNVNYADTLTHAIWPGGKSVSCSKPHQDYLYAVVELEGYERDTWRTSSTDPNVYGPIYSEAEQLCTEARSDDSIHVPDLGAVSFFLPAVESWKKGDRWVRCDYGQVAVGSSVYSPTFADLPASFDDYQKAVSADPRAFAFCINEPGSTSKTGPLTQQSSYFADCTKSPQWTRVTYGTLAGDTRPSKAYVRSHLDPKCGGRYDTARLTAIALIPSEQDWKNGSRYWQCWRTSRSST